MKRVARYYFLNWLSALSLALVCDPAYSLVFLCLATFIHFAIADESSSAENL